MRARTARGSAENMDGRWRAGGLQATLAQAVRCETIKAAMRANSDIWREVTLERWLREAQERLRSMVDNLSRVERARYEKARHDYF